MATSEIFYLASRKGKYGFGSKHSFPNGYAWRTSSF